MRRRLLFPLLTLGLVLVVLELLLQGFYFATAGDWLFQRSTMPIFAEDPVRGYRLQPNLDRPYGTNEFSAHMYTNAEGLRTGPRQETVAGPKPADEVRVLFLGPSFTFGWGTDYEDTYVARITEGLRVPGKRVVSVNLGTPAQPPAPQLCWLRAHGPGLDFDLIVQTTYGQSVPPMPPDCPDDLAKPIVQDGRLYTVEPTLARRAIATVKNLGLVFYGYYVYNALLPAEEREPGGLGKELYSEAEVGSGFYDAAFRDSYSAFAATVARYAGADARLVFLHLPLAYAIHEGDKSRWAHITDVSADLVRVRNERGTRILADAGVEIFDATPGLRAAALANPDERLYFWLDIHLTAAGNRVVADEALPMLQSVLDRAD